MRNETRETGDADPIDHPAFARMSLRELADLPFPRPGLVCLPPDRLSPTGSDEELSA